MSSLVTSSRLAIGLGVALPVAAVVALTSPDLAGAQVAEPSHAAKSTTKWTQISKDTGLGIASAGLFRTADGRLHVVWPSHDNLVFSVHYSTVGGLGKLLATGTIVHNWGTVSSYIELVPAAHGGMDAIFEGGNNVSGSPYNTGAMYIATSNPAGTSWKLVNGSLSQNQRIPGTDTAATTLADGRPVAAWTLDTALGYHVGIDPNIPAKTPDQVYNINDSGLGSPTLVRTKTGPILAGWFDTTGDKNEGYWVAQIWPTQRPKVKAPNSGGHNQNNGQPLQPVALVARQGGGSYLAYCVPTHVLACGHIALWRVGANRTLTVPGSSSGFASHVAMSNGRGGHLWIAWFNFQTNRISVVRTNAAATGFGRVLTINAPTPVGPFSGLEAEGSSGPLDLIALEQLNRPNSSPAYFVTQIDPALRIRASKTAVSNTRSTTITFTVDDSGDGVAGVTVRFLGKTATTNGKGVVNFTVKKGTARGDHSATATKTGYAPAAVTVKVT